MKRTTNDFQHFPSRAWIARGARQVVGTAPAEGKDAMRFGSKSARLRGFTLTELLIVVAMIGVLSALAMVGYRKYLKSAGSSEAKAVIQGIRIAEEAYKSERYVYLDCSSPSLTSNPYPRAPSSKKSAWDNPNHSRYNDWRTLNVVTDGPVRFGYAVMAGVRPDANPPNIAWIANWSTVFQNAEGPWFVVQATGDLDDDGITSEFVSASVTGQIFVGTNGDAE
jgi:type IV pilus assembly protein PilA